MCVCVREIMCALCACKHFHVFWFSFLLSSNPCVCIPGEYGVRWTQHVACLATHLLAFDRRVRMRMKRKANGTGTFPDDQMNLLRLLITNSVSWPSAHCLSTFVNVATVSCISGTTSTVNNLLLKFLSEKKLILMFDCWVYNKAEKHISKRFRSWMSAAVDWEL